LLTRVGVQVDVGELLGDQVQQARLGQPVDLDVELEALEDVAHRRARTLHVGAQVLADVSWSPISFFRSSGDVL
jgi:hypothetical protein